MVTRVATVAFEGIEARAVDVQVQVTPGGVAFILVGLIVAIPEIAIWLPCQFEKDVGACLAGK